MKSYVVSFNLHHRHLDESQRGMIAERIKPRYEAKVKERQQVHGGYDLGLALP